MAAFDSDTSHVSRCNQLVVDPTRARDGTLDLMTDILDLVLVAVVAHR